MLVHSSRLIDLPILSLHVGGEIARVESLIIDPNDLRLAAFKVSGPVVDSEEEIGDLLPVDSIREFSNLGMVIDSYDDLTDGKDIVRLEKILKLNFDLQGLKVITKTKVRLGKVSSFTLDTTTWSVQQLIVQRPIMKSLLDPELTISRDQIIEVTDYEVIVKAEKEQSKAKEPVLAPADFVPNFVNPFRKPNFTED